MTYHPFFRHKPNMFNLYIFTEYDGFSLSSWRHSSSSCNQHSKFLYVCSLNQTACCCMMFYFVFLLFSSSDCVPQWKLPSGCVKSLGAQSCQVSIFLVFPTFKQHQPPLQKPGGMCANSNSPVGSLAITAPLLYPCNCKGSCFLSDQPATLPPGRLASSPLAAPGI